MSSAVCVFLGCVPILPKNSIPNPVLVSVSVTPLLNAFLCFDPTLKKIFVSRHVKFVENVFSFVSLSTSALLSSSFPSCYYLALPPTTTTFTVELARTAPFITNTLPILPSSCCFRLSSLGSQVGSGGAREYDALIRNNT